jgi:hypothetical protein
VFLLDKGQPASVEEADWGKVVAVHAGAAPSSLKNRNYGFLINEHPVFNELQRESQIIKMIIECNAMTVFVLRHNMSGSE